MIDAAFDCEVLTIRCNDGVVGSWTRDSSRSWTRSRRRGGSLSGTRRRPVRILVDSKAIACTTEFGRVVRTEHVAVTVAGSVCAGAELVSAVASVMKSASEQ